MWFLVMLLAAAAPCGTGGVWHPTRGRFLGPSAGPIGPPAVHIPLPEPLAFFLLQHVRGMLAHGWAEDLTSMDLDHGHLLMKPGFTCPKPCTPERVAAGVAAILYHTAERSDRWEEEGTRGVPADRRTPRSIIGWPDGSVHPAIELVREQTAHLTAYESCGTVFHSDLPRLRADLFGEPWFPKVHTAFGHVTLTCNLNDQFDILQDAEGRFRLFDGRYYDAYLVCTYPEGDLKDRH